MGCGEHRKNVQKTGTQHMFYSIIDRSRIGSPAIPKTKLPVTLTNKYHKEVHLRHRRDPKSSDDISGNIPSHYTVGLNLTSGKSFSRSPVCIIDKGC